MKQKLKKSSLVWQGFAKCNMLYTKKGDKGTTKLYNSQKGERILKHELIFETLGALDELNSSLGYAKYLAKKNSLALPIVGGSILITDLINTLQEHLFILQATLSGSGMSLKQKHIDFLEKVILEVETTIPPINSFLISSGKETGSYLDICRTIARRAERLLVKNMTDGNEVVNEISLAYTNRLSSALYALARMANYEEGCIESAPSYD